MKTKTKPKKANLVQVAPIKSVLYVGTTELIAKNAPIKGISGPVILTDVYPAHFASSNSPNAKWGIVTIILDCLNPDRFLPFPSYAKSLVKKTKLDELGVAYKFKDKWEKSLKECGTCLYLDEIPSMAIAKVTIYNPYDKETNTCIRDESTKCDPAKINFEDHKAFYLQNKLFTKWLACEEFEINEKLNNRCGLDVFYVKNEKDWQSWYK